MELQGVFLLLPGWDASPSQDYPSIKFAGTCLYNRVERDTVRVKCLPNNTVECNTMPPPGFEPVPLDPETSVLATREGENTINTPGRETEIIFICQQCQATDIFKDYSDLS